MPVANLAHVTLRVNDMDAALDFHTRVMGLVEVERQRSSVLLTCGYEHGHDLELVPGGTGLESFTFQVDDADEVQRYRRLLGAGDYAAQVRHDALPDQPVVLELELPSGHRMRFVPAPEGSAYLNPGRRAARAGGHGVAPLHVDHVTLAFDDDERTRRTIRCLVDTLGFSVTDIFETDSRTWGGVWLRSGNRHHDIAFLRCRRGDSLHHLAWTMESCDHIKRGADCLAQSGLAVEAGPGRHGVGGNLYLYFWSPGGNRYELSSEMPRVTGRVGCEQSLVLPPGFNTFSAWGAERPVTFGVGS